MLGLLALMAMQMCAVFLVFPSFPAETLPALGWTFLPSHRFIVFGGILFGLLLSLALLRPRWRNYWNGLIEVSANHPRGIPLLAQCVAYGAALFFGWMLYFQPQALGVWGWPVLVAWCAAMAACAAFTLWMLAPASFWLAVWSREKPSIAAGAIGGGLAIGIAALLEINWGAESYLTRLTVHLSGALFSLIYPDAIVDPATATLGTGEFSVRIGGACSGSQGVGLTLALMACYCFVFRTEIRSWIMALLVPLAVALSLSLNVARIVLLVVLGIEVSPQLAVQGFHANAGSIAMVLTFALVVGLAHWAVVLPRLREAEPDVKRMGWTLDFESAQLVPFMALLAATLLTGALSGGFVWLYSLRVVAVALALALCWKHLRHLVSAPALAPVAIGVAVFGLWIALIDGRPLADSLFAQALDSVAPGLAVAWLAARFIGAVVTVPLAEELAFRGYLLTVLSRQPVRMGHPVTFDWLGFVGSSVLFGALHGQWLAGTVAGMGYAWARYRRGRLWDAVVAHMTTNLLLALFVLGTRQWSYW